MIELRHRARDSALPKASLADELPIDLFADVYNLLRLAALPIAPHQNETLRAASRRTGEESARNALLAAGCNMTPPHRKGPVPSWPNGFTGSIAHTATLAVAVAAPKTAAYSLGVDIEIAATLPTEDAAFVFSERELGFATSDALATVVWSAKEAAYKAWCTAIGSELAGVDPRDIEINFSGGCFTATARGELRGHVELLGKIQGHLRLCGPLIVTLAILTT